MEKRTQPTGTPPLARRPSRLSLSSSPSLTVLAALLAFALAACSGSDATAGSDADARPAPGRTVIGLSLPDLENEFFTQLRAGAEAEAEAQQVELVLTDAKGSASTQVRQLQQMSDGDVSAVIVAPVDARSVASTVRGLRADGVPVIAADREVKGARTDVTVSSHNSAGGWKAAETLAGLLDGEGEVVHLRGPEDASVSRDRGEGFAAGLAEHPGIEVVDSVRAGFDREAARKAMARLLVEHPGLSGVFAENDAMALGAVDALGARAGTSVQVVGFDGTEEARKAVERGELAATVAQAPLDMGKLAVRNALRLVAGDSVDPKIQVPVRVVRSEG